MRNLPRIKEYLDNPECMDNKYTFNNKLTENIVSEKLYDKRGRGAAMLSTPKSLKTIN